MSGIFGMFSKNAKAIDQQSLESMRLSMKAWGADGSSICTKNNYGAGFLLTYNTPESFLEKQPIVSGHSGRYVFTCDIRIDNREDLARSLHVDAQELKSSSDSRLLVSAFLKWGEKCVEHLVGAYAFAVWDSANQELLLARDYMGFRPLYYYDDPQKFIFASDINAILAVEDVDAELDAEMIAAARASYTRPLADRSLYVNIHKVKPAHLLKVSARGVVVNRYWDPRNIPKQRFSSNGEYADQMYDLVNQAVESSIRSSFPIGAHLSGGLDSTSITILASRKLRLRGEQLSETFAWSPAPEPDDYPLSDERKFIEQVCAIERLPCNYSKLDADEIVDVWKGDMSRKPKEQMFRELSVRREAAIKGVRTLLSGWGGDEFASFNGRGFYAEQLINFKWYRLLTEMKAHKRLGKLTFKGLAYKHMFLPLMPDSFYARRKKLLPVEIGEDPYISDKVKSCIAQLAVESRPRATLRENHINFFYLGWLTNRIEAWAASGVESKISYRYPLLDQRVVEYCLGLPSEQFVQNGWNRFVFRNAMSRVLPREICWHWDNKTENALLVRNLATTSEAASIFATLTESRSIPNQGVSSMWRDKLPRK